MTDFCFGCLPPYAAQQALAEKTQMKRFELALNEISSDILDLKTKSNAELTKWAYCIVRTRYQELSGGDHGIIPMADYFNHGGAETDAYISYDDDGNCYVYSTRDVPAGQQLRICYGDPTNPSKLLAQYGFLDESMSATFCKWVVDEPSEQIFNLGYPSKMLFYNDGSVSNEVWDVVLYEELGKVSLEEQQTFYQTHLSGDETAKQGYREKHFAQIHGALDQHVNYILDELDELEIGLETQMSIGLNAHRHPRLPLLMSHNEFVKNTFQLVQQNLNQIFS
jgi:hypothetical protein